MIDPANAPTERLVQHHAHDDLPTPHHSTHDYEPDPVLSERSPISLSLAISAGAALILAVGFAVTLRVQLEYVEQKVKETQATGSATQADVAQIKTDVALIRLALDQRNVVQATPKPKAQP